MAFKGIYNQTGQHGNYDPFGGAKWKANITVNMGDLIYQDSTDSNYTKPAACFTYVGNGTANTTNTVATQQNFAGNFAGVSGAQRISTQTTDGDGKTDGPIYGAGEYVYSIDSTTANQSVGTMIAIANSGNTILSQNVTITSNVSLAIGYVSQPYLTGLGQITVKLKPFRMDHVGVQAKA